MYIGDFESISTLPGELETLVEGEEVVDYDPFETKSETSVKQWNVSPTLHLAPSPLLIVMCVCVYVCVHCRYGRE